MAEKPFSGLDLPPDWHVPTPYYAQAYLDQLARELCKGHALYEKKLRAVAKHNPDDDVLFAEIDGDQSLRYWIVHLTWNGAQTDPRFPSASPVAFPADLWQEYRLYWR